MRLALASFLICSFSFLSPAVADDGIVLSKPPASLSQWYKPDNKRNVWHHNMFKLRRETQAVNEYLTENNQELTKKWALRLVDHYKKIGEMVPEWKDELEIQWADKLTTAANDGDFKTVSHSLQKLQKSCDACHKEYRAQVAAIYRSPDFKKVHVQIEGKQSSYLDFMKLLMRDLNRIKIASEDGNKDKAQLALKAVRSGVETLRSSCDNCHKGAEAKDYYLGKKTKTMLDELEAAIETGKSGRALGGFAVQACAKCHGSHRIIYDLKGELH